MCNLKMKNAYGHKNEKTEGILSDTSFNVRYDINRCLSL